MLENKNQPLYLDVFNRIKAKLREEYYNEKLPPIRELAAEYDISESTMKKILSQLKQQNFIYGKQGKGVFVNPDFSEADEKLVLFFLPRDKKGNPFYEKGLQLIQEFMAHDSSVVVQVVDSAAKINRKLDSLMYVILMEVNDRKVAEEIFKSVPAEKVIQFNCRFNDRAPSVCSNNFLGGYQSVECLYNLGHRNIAIIATGYDWTVDYSIFADRMNGVKEFCRQHKLNPTVVEAIPNSVEKGYEAAGKLFPHNKFTAVYCFTDLISFGVLRYCAEHRIAIPDDISILGYDDMTESAHTLPSLASSREDIQGMLNAIIAYVKGTGELHAEIKPVLIRRDSIRQIKSSTKG